MLVTGEGLYSISLISVLHVQEKKAVETGTHFQKKFKDSGSGAVKDVEAWNPGHQEQVSACSTNP